MSVNAIPGLISAAPIRSGPRRSGAGGFTIPDDVPELAAPAQTQAIGLPSLLALQEAGQDIVRDREARQHGEALLDALTKLQQALLGSPDPAVLDRLAALVRRTPTPADPRLAAVQRALLVRVAVERARARVAASV